MRRHALQSVLALLGLAVSLLGSSGAAASPSDGTVLGVTKVIDNGPAAGRFNLVLIGDGYRAGEQALFANDVQDFVDFLFATPPFDSTASAFNVWRIDVASADSGADDPTACGGTGALVDTYFDASFCNGGIRRLLVVDNSTVFSILASLVPEWDQVLVIVNTTVYGGSGGAIGVTSVSGSWELIAIHELGHSAFGLADEYEYWSGCGVDTNRDHHPPIEPVQPNVTVETNPALLKWIDLVLPSTPLPTTQSANCSVCDRQPDPFPGQTVVGLYEGAHYYHCDAFRPAFHCMMRNFAPFCPVCRARIAEVLAPFTSSLQCGDGVDNDGDGLVDVSEDPGCDDQNDASEQSAVLVCDDGLDNDGDTLVDYPDDPGCPDPMDASEDDAYLVAGRQIIVRDKRGDPSKRKIVIFARDEVAIQTPRRGGAGDPRSNGAVLRVVNPSGSDDAVFNLPPNPPNGPEFWTELGRDPEGEATYKYVDKGFVNGPCKLVVIEPGKLIRAKCLARRPGADIPFSLDEGPQGSLTVTLQLGSSHTYCMSFGGSYIEDRDVYAPSSGVGLFKRVGAPAPQSCPLP